MKIKKIEILHLRIPLKRKFKHSLMERKFTDNIILRIYSESNFGIGECVPREYVTGENPYSVLKNLKEIIIPKFTNKKFNNKEEIFKEIKLFLKTIKKNELSAFACFEDALINLVAKEFKFKMKDILNYLNIKFKKKKSIEYSAIIDDTNIVQTIIKALIIKKRKFNSVKIKVNPDSSKKLYIIRQILKNQKLRVDANCSFNIKNINKFIDTLKELNISKFEQPYKTTDKNKNIMDELCKMKGIEIIYDESACTLNEIKNLNSSIQLRISKNGGIINSLQIYEYLEEKNINVYLGCMVGETILTKENIIFGEYLDFIETEGDYDKYLFEKKITKNPNFNKKGILKYQNIDIDQNFKINNNYLKYILCKSTLEF